MDLEFDKQIDALLRKSLRGDPAAGPKSAHLDADEIAAFADNALPAATRSYYVAHLSDCERCRTVLSQAISLRADAVNAAAPSLRAIEGSAAVPWYRRLLSGPSLAYVMGALVLLFSGFLGYTLLQREPRLTERDISQVSEQAPSGAAPNYGAADSSSNSANSSAADQIANSSGRLKQSNADAAEANSATPTLPTGTGAGSPVVKSADEDGLLDQRAANSPPPPPPAAEPTVQPKPEQDEATRKDKDQLAAAEGQTFATDAKKRAENKLLRESPAVAAPSSKSAAAGALRSEKDNVAQKLAKNDAFAPRRVGGRNFTKKDGVWYDTAFRGQTTINVRRGTDDYRRLDRGLRSIAETLGGTVVTIWKEKAYRIQ